jgi:hypothetical protein
MKNKWIWLALLVPAVAAIATVYAVDSWGGVDGPSTSILRNANRAEVFRVSPKYSPEKSDGTIGGYPIIALGTEPGPESITRITNALRRWGVSKASKKLSFEPTVAFRIWYGDKALDVLLSFDSDQLWTHVVGDPNSSEEMLDFAPARAEFLALVKEAFPDNPKIQALPDNRRS